MKSATATHSSLTQREMESIRALDACAVSNAIETFGVRLANEGFCDARIHCFFPDLPPMLGYAATGRLQVSAVPITGQRCLERTDFWEYLAALPAPRVLVLEDVSPRPGLGAFLGEVHSAIFLRLGCAGAVTNGAVRDLPAVENLGFALFAANAAVSHCYARLLDFGQPVTVAGLQVRPGDLIFGDRHGVLSIPREIAPEIPAAAARLKFHEKRILDVCRSDRFSLEALRECVSGRTG